MKRMTRLGMLAGIALVVGISGCGTTQARQGEVIGGVVGGLIGNQIGDGSGRTAAIIIGTLAGSMIGREVGESMDQNDRMYAAQTLNDNRTGESMMWTNPDNGNVYEVTPTRTYEVETGPCREFTLNASVGGGPNQEVYSTACLQADGSWKLQP
ncbi:MAG: glycine zipper 2TM domain-containing protein [Gammaproteobacteria bacterium]|nr:glycine zipper 2TM domain-containing protein [Gammaproteobacteria bacterium]